MDKQRMEIILPAQKNMENARKIIEPQVFLSDLLHVNPIVDNRNLKSSKKSNSNQTVKNFNKNVKFENLKQEQHYRLNRENKLQQNKDWAEILKKNSTENISKSQNCLKKIAETNKHVNEAKLQLEEINAFIESKKNNFVKKNSIKSQEAKSQIKHLCTKEIYAEKLNDIDSMMKYLDKNMKVNEQVNRNKQRQKNNPQRKKINETLGVMNTKLNKVRDKYFNNDFETNHINSIINKRPKYRSVKELMKFDKTQLSTMEASKLIQAELDNDINDLSDIDLLTPRNNHIEVLYENVDLIKKESFQDNFSDEQRTENSLSTKITEAPRMLHEEARKYLNTTLSTKTADKKIVKNTTVDTQTPIPNKLQRSVLKSDYLMKEFGLDASRYSAPTVENIAKKQWNKELDYFMS